MSAATPRMITRIPASFMCPRFRLEVSPEVSPFGESSVWRSKYHVGAEMQDRRLGTMRGTAVTRPRRWDRGWRTMAAARESEAERPWLRTCRGLHRPGCRCVRAKKFDDT